MRIPFIILALLLFSHWLPAQSIRFSYLANPQLTWFSGKGNGYEANGSFLGFNTGIELDFFFTENYAFSTGLTIQSNRGGIVYEDSMTFNLNNEDYLLPSGSKLTNNLQHVSIPLGLKFKTIEIGYSTYWINTGITPMILINSKATDESKALNKTNFKDQTHPINLNYFVEGGLEYSLGGNTAVIAGIGYYSGFMDISKSDPDKLTTHGFSLILGLLF